MGIKDTFLYYWYFLSNRDETKSWHQQNNCRKIGGVVIFILSIVVFFSFSLIGDQMTISNNCLSGDGFFEFVTICGLTGLKYLFLAVMAVILLGLTMGPCLGPIVYLLSDYIHRKIDQIVYIIVYYVLLVMIVLLWAIYQQQLFGVVFERIVRPDEPRCQLSNYESLMKFSCTISGFFGSLIIGGIYLGILALIWLLSKCSNHCNQTHDAYLNEQLPLFPKIPMISQ